jgi:outer membrane protein W
MRIVSRLRSAALSGAAAAAALALIGMARPAQAQTVLPDAKSPTIGAIRGGVYFPFNSTVKTNVGKTFYGGGIDYTFQQKANISRTNLSVDYIERSSGGNDIRIIPVTFSEFALQSGQSGIRPYYGIGVGAYFIRQNIPDSIGNRENTNATALGGFLAAGLDLPDNLLIEARYHIIQKEGSANASGLQVTAGIRF